MSLFREEHHGLVGIDIGVAGIKLVELVSQPRQPWRLASYAIVEQSKNIIKDSEPATLTFLSNAIAAAHRRARMQSRAVVTVIPNVAVFQSLLSVPQVPQRELQNIVLEEATKIIPLPLSDVTVDWRVVAPAQPAGMATGSGMIHKSTPQLQVFVTATPKAILNRFVSVVRQAKLELVGVETQSSALVRALVGNDPSPTLLVDVGHRTTDLMLVHGGLTTLTRSVDVGGEGITKLIAEQLGLDQPAAEQFKKDLAAQTRVGNAQEPAPAFVMQALGQLLDEIRYVLKTAPEQQLGDPEKIILTGGSAFLPGLEQLLRDTFHLPTVIGDPLARVVYPEELQLTLGNLGPRLSLALGCAMRPA